MPKKIDWFYVRKGWTSCKRSQEFLAKNDVAIQAETSASAKLGREKALELLAGASRVIIAKGKKVNDFDLKKAYDEEEVLTHMLGTTGNLRAPTIKRGQTLLVGFNDERYADILV